MNLIIKYFSVLLAVLSLSSTGYAEEKVSEDLLGIITKEDLQKEPYVKWYKDSETSYSVDQNAINDINALLKGVDIKIVMGTWCHDSKREVPRFYKILSQADAVNVTMIALDRKKNAPNGETNGLEITNTPTFIFMKNGQELNRIVEVPVESLEKDMMKILKGESYKHSKMK